MKALPVKKEIMGIYLSDITLHNVSEYVVGQAKNSTKKLFIVTPNPEMVVYASSHQDVQDLLNKADLALCDGVGLFAAAYLLGNPVKERITGVDLLDELCGKAAKEGLSIGFLGGRGGVAELTAECLREKYKNLIVSFTGSDWDVRSFPKQGVDILFVAYGFPKQEKWIGENLPILPIKVAMGVGGAFDYLSGTVPRAPFIMRAIGLEWAFRLIVQPWRYKRQTKLLTFLWLVVREYCKVQLKKIKDKK